MEKLNGKHIGHELAEAKSKKEAIKGLERREWQLWFLSIFVIVALTFTILAFLYPSTFWNISAVHIAFPFSRQVFVALVVLVGLLVSYLIEREVAIKGLRTKLAQQILSSELNGKLILIDYVSGAYNRRYLDEVIAREKEKLRRYKRPISLILVSVDDLKGICSKLGYLVGDAFLRDVANVLKSSIRVFDMVFRFSGDEFLIFLFETEDVQKILDRIKDKVAELNQGNPWGVTLSLSFGFSTWAPDQEFQEALQKANNQTLLDRKVIKGMVNDNEHARVFIQAPITLKGVDSWGISFEEKTQTFALSKYGAIIRVMNDLEVAKEVEIITESGDKFTAKVLWKTDGQVGVECPGLADALCLSLP